MALTVACVPTGMKTGVSMYPRGMVIRPVRAEASPETTSNLKDEHGVSITEKTVPPFYGLAIGLHYKVISPEGAGEHEKG